MKIKFINDDINKLEKELNNLSQSAKSILILSCDENNYNTDKMNNILKEHTIPIIGAIFPQIIYKNKNYKKGTILVPLDDYLDILLIKNLSSSTNKVLDEKIEKHYDVLSNDTKMMFVFVDALSKNINNLISTLFDNFGLSINYIGAGAGSLSFIKKPSIITNTGIHEDCAVIASSILNSEIGVKHGWTPISQALKVTKSKDNRIIELDYKPAYHAYKEIVEKYSKKSISKENFFDIAKDYPLGINKLQGDIIVRDPIILEDTSLVCIGEINENSFVSVLKGDVDSLINAALQAKEETIIKEKNYFVLFIDCISRVLFLKEEFHKELDIVNDDEHVIIGALTLGEIANNKKHYLEFYNKTAVIAKVEDNE
ncbi:FIST C-terminal domain-containing protein [Poseidonibacter lekithochrous]|uniref:FIST signal transduction protein n=1 Tax=Poseidonibacter TaxID=2321187 RepID=UPI001C08AA18|nr:MULTISPECIES: FIST C-terminal domain-containing protein [Poseidonibacter]MBU3015160.1 FIST C-terminal domain-containing protein [Poseidonibacter lekithochrous]MDO6828457.1 FIST N-terminal domain-containing protein [Poseidonibacter sp. 1_MG-2023]